jgi:hypothetical protein
VELAIVLVLAGAVALDVQVQLRGVVAQINPSWAGGHGTWPQLFHTLSLSNEI